MLYAPQIPNQTTTRPTGLLLAGTALQTLPLAWTDTSGLSHNLTRDVERTTAARMAKGSHRLPPRMQSVADFPRRDLLPSSRQNVCQDDSMFGSFTSDTAPDSEGMQGHHVMVILT